MIHFQRLPIMFAVLCSLSISQFVTAQSAEPKPKVSPDPLTSEQLAVYKAVLHGWMDDGESTVRLQAVTDPFPTGGAFDSRDCLKGMDMEPDNPGLIHRFRTEDLSQLGSGRIRLVDPEKQRKEVEQNDPGRAIANGASVDDAVKNGFAHGRTWLSEIRFDKTHTHAVVFYGFICGSLCGNGGTIILEKKANGWTREAQCSNWMS
ncbi:MAG: hypothetical protein ACLGSD_07300 [Acidobacteriota bacterium]